MARAIARAEQRWPHSVNLWETLEAALRACGDGLAAVDGDARLTWSEVARRTRALAQFLRERGLGPGERLALLERNSLAFLETSYAACGLGACLVPLNWRLAPPELAAVLAASGARRLVAATEFAPLVEQQAGALDDVLWIGPPPRSTDPGYAAAVAGPLTDFRPVDVAPDAVAQLYFTSGTTGRPKGVMLTHRNIGVHAEGTIAELALTARDVWLHAAPMFHLADAWATFALTWAGGTHVFAPRFEEARVLELLEREGVTLTNLIPTMLQRLVSHPGAGMRDWSRLRLLLSGGAPIAPAVVRRVMEVFRCEYAQTYGLTETSPYLTFSLLDPELRALPEEEQLRWRTRTGRPFHAVEVVVIGDDGRPVPRDDATVGEVRARGPTVTPGYWNDPAATAEAFENGWLKTGDLATVDARGSLRIVDRKKDMIITGGEKVFSTEVEHALYAHPAVLEAAVFGVPDAEWGEAVCAAVVLRPGARASADELRAHCRQELAGYKVPRAVRFLAELPRTGSGKILKRALRDG
jgi:acyl-CoA synthetase (AMP-forming)/AMP-acid ligase II